MAGEMSDTVSRRRISPLARVRGMYYGWAMVLALSITETTSFGILYYAFAVFLTPMHEDLGWSVAQLTGAFSLALLISGVAAVPVGRWLDRRGPRALMTAGSIVATLLVLAWAMVDSLIVYYLIWIGIGVVMAAVLYEPAFYVVATWFRRGRGRALTVLTFLAGLASVIFIPLASVLVNAYDWRTALVILALILGVVTIPLHGLVLRRNPEALGLEVDGGRVGSAGSAPVSGSLETSVTVREALRAVPFWWLNAAFFLANLATMTIIVHLIPYLIREGYSPAFAASAAGAIGLLALPGRLIFTPLGGRIERRYVTAGIFACQTVALLVLLLSQSTAGVIAFVILFGIGFGAITPARAALVSEMYGPAHYGSINGIVSMFITASRGIAPFGAGVLFTILASYQPVLWTTFAVSLLASVAALQARSAR
ncbi:MAG TPA: MFS transporter [Thermomicrobiales bacterium]|nr:MFS transporter [Thermomicrobiales bacterium]